MGRGAQYPFVSHLLLELSRNSARVLELGCGAAVYRPLFESRNYIATDTVNPWYQSKGDVDVFASATHLPFPSESFDLVFSQAALDFMPQTTAVLREACRVLRPGGRFLVVTYRKRVLKRIHRDSVRQGVPHYGVYSSGQLVAWLKCTGFDATEVPRPRVYDGGPTLARLKAVIAGVAPFGAVLRWRSNWRIFLGTKKSAG